MSWSIIRMKELAASDVRLDREVETIHVWRLVEFTVPAVELTEPDEDEETIDGDPWVDHGAPVGRAA